MIGKKNIGTSGTLSGITLRVPGLIAALTCALLLSWIVGPAGFSAPRAFAQENPEAVSPLAPSAPALVSPNEGEVHTGVSTPPHGVPTLTWQPVPGATRYTVQVSASLGFATPIIDQITYATSYTPDIALADGVYYWRVKSGDNKEWGAYSEARSFTKDWSAGETIAPVLLSPQANATRTAFAQGDFSWTTVPGAAYYLFEIAPDEAFGTILYSEKTISPHHTPIKRLANNRYYWRVTPLDNQNHAGKASEVRAFDFNWNVAPQLLEPEHGVDSHFLPAFAWSAVEAAEVYQLEISTQPDFGAPNKYVTANTRYTPEKALSNDQDYYWRVKAIDNQGSSSPWSEVRRFKTRWNFQARLLTPANNGILRGYPFFSWTPIPGVEQYQIQIDKSTSFDNPIGDEEIYNATFYTQPGWRDVLLDFDYFWRVRGIDAQGNYTPWSNISSFRMSKTSTSNLIYPLYYFAPDVESLPVHQDRTIAWPVFVWDTAHYFDSDDPSAIVLETPDYYRLTVSSDPTFFTAEFEIESAGLGAAPTLENPFNDLVDGRIYYWRVRAYRNDGTQLGSEEVWLTRIDRATPQLPTSDSITPIHPADSFDTVEAAPVLGWLPVNGAHHYRVQLARDRFFTEIVEEARPQFVNYVPGQGSHDDLPFGTYWWRVRAETNGNEAIGSWSETRHFNLSRDIVTGNPYDFTPPVAPATILDTGDLYDPALTYIASSPNVAAEPNDVGDLHVMLDRTFDENYYWVVAFQTANVGAASLRYGIYVDVDHVENSGATSDPLGKPISVEPLYLPEYVLYINRSAGAVSPNDVFFFRWNGSGWDPAQPLAAIGGNIHLSPDNRAVQLLIPYTSIGTATDDFSGSLALTVFSTGPAAGDGILDAVPAQNGIIDNPAFVSDMLMPLYPFDTPLSNPVVYREAPALRWRMPYFDSVDGYQVEVARDSRFTDIVETWETYESKTWPHFAIAPASFHTLNAYEDNESYYWRVRIRHERYRSNQAFFDYGPWSPAMRFKLNGLAVSGAETLGMLPDGITTRTTPSFAWERVEGAAGYTIQIDDDANFSKPVVNKQIDSTSYTPLDALPDGLYYWRVAPRRSSKVLGQWSPVMTFDKRSLTPTPLAPTAGLIINGLPTFTWQPVLTTTGELQMAAPRYQVQWDDDPNFGSPTTASTEASSYTLPKGKSLPDGTYYWRVAIVDADNHTGAYSPAQQFYKEYLPPELVSPPQGGKINTDMNFAWTSIPGAAYYRIEIADNDSFNRPIVATTDNTRYAPTRQVTYGEFFWRVQMVDDDNKAGPYQVGRVGAPAPPLPNLPDYDFNVYLPAFSFEIP